MMRPSRVMGKVLDSEVQGRKFRFEGIKSIEKAPTGGVGGSRQKNKNDYSKGGNKNAQQQP